MTKKSISYVVMAFALVLQIAIMPLQASAADPEKAPTWISPINYLALGDSLAAGVTPTNELGIGYTDLLAEKLAKQEVLLASNKGFSYPGYKTADVLRDFEMDVTKPIVGMGHSDQTATLHQSVKETNLITLTIGANDVLPNIKFDDKGTPVFNSDELTAAMMKVGSNTQQILAKIYALNPDAQVYVMGYYNPFPYLSPQNQPMVDQLVMAMNSAIKSGLTGTTAQFVETAKQIAEDPYTYLPNPENIHLSQAGYKVVMEAFHKSLMENYSWFAKDAFTVTAKDATTVELNWVPVIDTGMISTYQIFNGDKMVGEVMSPIVTYEITDLQPNKEYHFSVQAVDQNGKKSMQHLNAKYTLDKEPVEPTVMFTDITNHWAKDVIEMAAMKGIVSGYADHTFRPDKSLTRAQATSILVRALNLKPKSTKWAFNDLADYADSTKKDIQAAYDHGLVSGVNGHFMPNQPITRAQLALVLSRAYEVATGKPFTPTVAAPFTDIKKFSKDTQWAIAGLYQMNIATGDNGKFMPNDPTTRAHAAKMIVHSMEAIAQ
ncbi:S-layer homology domain-containing protein [Sporosarcina ureae]|uniref:S-layer homology domain-containing protein n=1 Tax=Sporosarcina ureae TaxID=1571 RepID=UPI0026F326B6|nr:S-layer homology domain-containing protein [Sporosarcina ureae]